MFETAAWLEQFRGEPVTVLEGALAAQAREQRAEDAEAQREAERKAEAAEARAEGLALANRALGNPLGEVSALRSALTAADDEVGELQEKLDKAKARQESVRSNLQWWSERLAIATETVAARSEPLRQDPAEVALMRAKAALDDERRRGRVVLARSRAKHERRFR
jgi:hypothetical protein